ncbi:MAG: hypothetical protein GY710_15365 [Desulfobacteraceae bacterium]|nr:hypothetical protein [Desulfobacteraceae bacterium]
MNQRPRSVTVICWILIIMGAISLVTCTMSLNNPMAKELMAKNVIPVNVQYIVMYVGLLIMVVSGVAMLKGQNWARLLYVGWGIISFAIGIVTSPMKVALIPGLLIFLIIIIFLFRPGANKYFKATEAV